MAVGLDWRNYGMQNSATTQPLSGGQGVGGSVLSGAGSGFMAGASTLNPYITLATTAAGAIAAGIKGNKQAELDNEAKKEEQRRYEEKMRLEKQQMGTTNGLNGLQQMASDRAEAMKSFRPLTFDQALLAYKG
jgi:hypothetical protein